MVLYTYLGYGTTDNKGVAVLNHDANGNTLTDSYTGVGAGKINLIASFDSSITSSSTVSDTVTLLDCLYYFTNSYSSYKNNYVDVEPKTNSIKFVSNSSSNNGLIYLSDDNSFITGNYAFEFKLIAFSSDTVGIRCPNSSSTSLQRTISDLNADVGDVIRFENNGTNVICYVNDTQVTTRSNNGTIKYGFNIPVGESIEVTDMKVYPTSTGE